jgi:hypothetical protein
VQRARGFSAFFARSPAGFAVEREVSDDLLQLGVFVAQGPELAQLLQAEPAELLLPPVERLLADAEPATDRGDLFAAFDLVQGVDNLFVAAAFAGHRLRLLGWLSPACLGNHRTLDFHLSAVLIFGFWVSSL